MKERKNIIGVISFKFVECGWPVSGRFHHKSFHKQHIDGNRSKKIKKIITIKNNWKVKDKSTTFFKNLINSNPWNKANNKIHNWSVQKETGAKKKKITTTKMKNVPSEGKFAHRRNDSHIIGNGM